MAMFCQRIGPANAGGTSSCRFADVEGTSFLDLQLTWVSVSFVRVVRP